LSRRLTALRLQKEAPLFPSLVDYLSFLRKPSPPSTPLLAGFDFGTGRRRFFFTSLDIAPSPFFQSFLKSCGIQRAGDALSSLPEEAVFLGPRGKRPPLLRRSFRPLIMRSPPPQTASLIVQTSLLILGSLFLFLARFFCHTFVPTFKERSSSALSHDRSLPKLTALVTTL